MKDKLQEWWYEKFSNKSYYSSLKCKFIIVTPKTPLSFMNFIYKGMYLSTRS